MSTTRNASRPGASAWRPRARSMAAAEKSTPNVGKPCSANQSATSPWPQPMSRTRSPAGNQPSSTAETISLEISRPSHAGGEVVAGPLVVPLPPPARARPVGKQETLQPVVDLLRPQDCGSRSARHPSRAAPAYHPAPPSDLFPLRARFLLVPRLPVRLTFSCRSGGAPAGQRPERDGPGGRGNGRAIREDLRRPDHRGGNGRRAAGAPPLDRAAGPPRHRRRREDELRLVGGRIHRRGLRRLRDARVPPRALHRGEAHHEARPALLLRLRRKGPPAGGALRAGALPLHDPQPRLADRPGRVRPRSLRDQPGERRRNPARRARARSQAARGRAADPHRPGARPPGPDDGRQHPLPISRRRGRALLAPGAAPRPGAQRQGRAHRDGLLLGPLRGLPQHRRRRRRRVAAPGRVHAALGIDEPLHVRRLLDLAHPRHRQDRQLRRHLRPQAGADLDEERRRPDALPAPASRPGRDPGLGRACPRLRRPLPHQPGRRAVLLDRSLVPGGHVRDLRGPALLGQLRASSRWGTG